MTGQLVYAVVDKLIVSGEVSGTVFFAEFREHLEGQGKSGHTISAYLSDLKKFAEWFVGTNGMAFFPSCVTNHDLRAYRQYCREVERVAASTLNRRLATLQKFVAWAKADGHLDEGAELFGGVKRGRKVLQPAKWLEENEYHRLMRCAEQAVNTGIWVGAKQVERSDFGRKMALRDMALLSLMVLCGLRVAEVAALRVGEAVIGERSGSVQVYGGKGDKDRDVPLNAEARQWVGKWIEAREKGEMQDDDRLFLGRDGSPLGVNGIQERVKVISQAAGLEGVTPHRLRHTFGRRFMVANRGSLGDDALMILARLMGHERLETTMRYAQPGRAEMAAAVEKL